MALETPSMARLNWKRSRRTLIIAYLAVQSLFYGFGLLYFSSVIPSWGRWYSWSPHYSAQANALLNGELALSHSPLDLKEDLAWSEGGVQQVWGLGVPFLRLPWVALAHLFGRNVFPDHLATGFFFSGVAFLLLVTLLKRPITRGSSLLTALPLIGCLFIILLFPPFLSLLSTTAFAVYEEAVAHAYLYAVAEAVLLLRLFQRPTPLGWGTLMLVAGCGPLVRPTLIFYGVATWLVGTQIFIPRRKTDANSPTRKCGAPPIQADCPGTRAEQRVNPRNMPGLSSLFSGLSCRFHLGTWAAGSLLFALGIALLMTTNWIRFGRPTEFGHKINVQGQWYEYSLCSSRFSHEFERLPLTVVMKELAGSMFFQKVLRQDEDWCRPARFWGLSDVPRMRKQYFRAYDWTSIFLLAGAGFLVAHWVWRSLRGTLHRRDSLLMKMGAWCLLSLAPLFWFYLRTPAMTTRYLLDFGAGFAVLTAILWLAVVRRCAGCWRIVFILCLGAWIGWESVMARKLGQSPLSLTREEKIAQGTWADAPKATQSIHVGSAATSRSKSGIPYDQTGWSLSTGRVLPLVIVFVEDAQFLDLELARAPGPGIDPDPLWVRAKIGLEFLERESVVWTGDAWRIRFKGPKRKSYRTGIQPAFIMFVPDTHIANKKTPWILQRIRWRDPAYGDVEAATLCGLTSSGCSSPN